MPAPASPSVLTLVSLNALQAPKHARGRALAYGEAPGLSSSRVASLAASEDYVRLSVRAAKTPKALAEAPIMRRQTRSRRPSAPGWPLDGSASPAGFADRSEQRL